MNFGREPARWIGLIVTILLGILQTLQGEGIVSDVVAGQVSDGINALAQLAVLLSPLIAGFIIRQQVYSPVTTQAIANRAAVTGNTDIGEPPSGDTSGPDTTTGPVSG